MTADNLATRYIRSAATAIVDRDWAAIADSLAEGFRMEDHRSGLRSTLDKAETVAMNRVLGELGVDAIEVEVLEMRGNHIALCRITNHVHDFTVCTLSITLVAEDGRGLVFVMYDEDALDAARAELDVLAGHP